MSQVYEVIKTFKLNVDGQYFYPGEHVTDLDQKDAQELLSKSCIKAFAPDTATIKSVKSADKTVAPKDPDVTIDDFTALESVTDEIDSDMCKAGFKTVEDVAAADPNHLAKVEGVNFELAEKIKFEAGELIKAEAN